MKRRIFGPGLALAALVFWATDTQGLFYPVLLAAAVHELGHLAAFAALGARVQGLSFDGGGPVLRYGRMLSYRRDALAALAGPGMNFLASAVCAYLAEGGFLPPGAYRFAGAGIALGLYNLLPALPLDGARVLYAAAAVHAGPARAGRIVRAATGAVGAAMCALGLYILLKTRYNISMFAQGCLILGGCYAQGTGKSAAAGAEAGALRRRRIRTDHQGSGKGRDPHGILLSRRIRDRHVESRREDPLRSVQQP